MNSDIPRDSSAEARLLSKISALALRSARRVLRRKDEDLDAAHDLAQQVVLDCLVRLRTGRWRVHTSLDALVAAMVWRKHAWGMRGEQHRAERGAQYLDEREAQTPMWMDPEAIVEERENETLYRRALSELPARCREAFLLVRDEGVSCRDAA